MKVLCIAFIVASLVSLAYAQELVCGDMATNAGRNLNELYCPQNMFFRDILFSSFGSATGSCSTGFSRSSSCDYNPESVRSIITTACLGRNACRYFPIERQLFGNLACATNMRLTLRCAYPTVSADICLMAQVGTDAIVECPIIGNTFTYLTNSVTYASYGTPCFKQYLYGSCHLSSSLSYITSRCVGQQRCTFPVDSSITDPCPDLAKTFIAKANCSNTGKSCTMAAQGTTFDLMCQPGSTITGIEFASYGNARGNCSSGITTSFCHDDYYNHDYFGDSYLGFFGSPGFTTKESCNSTSKTLIIGGTCRG